MINICPASVVLLRRRTLVGGFLLATCIHDKKLLRHVARIPIHMFLLGLCDYEMMKNLKAYIECSNWMIYEFSQIYLTDHDK